MRVSELARRADVSVATVKFYVRSGLLHAGERTGPNQSRYGASHLHRLRLVRALLEVGGLSVVEAGAVLESVDDRDLGVHQLLGRVQRSVMGNTPPRVPDSSDARVGSVNDLISLRGWRVGDAAPARSALAGVLDAAAELGHADLGDLLDAYATAAEELAARELDWVSRAGNPDQLAERVIIGTLLGDAMLAAVRRLAQTAESAARA